MKSVLDISHTQQYWTEGKLFSLLTPFRDFSKTELVKQYLNHGGSLDALLNTVSCYAKDAIHCGRCSSCFKRWVALTNATGLDFGRHFQKHPALLRTREEWISRSHLDKWSTRRIEETFGALDIARL